MLIRLVARSCHISIKAEIQKKCQSLTSRPHLNNHLGTVESPIERENGCGGGERSTLVLQEWLNLEKKSESEVGLKCITMYLMLRRKKQRSRKSTSLDARFHFIPALEALRLPEYNDLLRDYNRY